MNNIGRYGKLKKKLAYSIRSKPEDWFNEIPSKYHNLITKKAWENHYKEYGLGLISNYINQYNVFEFQIVGEVKNYYILKMKDNGLYILYSIYDFQEKVNFFEKVNLPDELFKM